jgi:preprotein translocase subunit SecE
VAESKRRGDKTADERLDDEVFVDAVDDDNAPSEDFSDEEAIPARGGAPTATKTAKTGKEAKSATSVTPAGAGGSRIARFVREVVAEMRKVNWPSRKELVTYTLVVLAFVITMMLIVGGLDYLFAWVVSHLFAG